MASKEHKVELRRFKTYDKYYAFAREWEKACKPFRKLKWSQKYDEDTRILGDK